MDCKSVLGKGLVFSATATELKKLKASHALIASVFAPFSPLSKPLASACAKAAEGMSEILALLGSEPGDEEEGGEEVGVGEPGDVGGEELADDVETAAGQEAEGDAAEESAEGEPEYEEETAEASEEDDAVSEFSEFEDDDIEGELSPDDADAETEEEPEVEDEPEPTPPPKAAAKQAAAPAKPVNALLAKKQKILAEAQAKKAAAGK